MTFLPAVPVMTERHWLQQLIGAMGRDGRRHGGLLRMLGWSVWHDESINSPRRCPRCHQEMSLPRSESGFPDLVLIRDDTLWLVELKADRGRLSPAQRGWYEALLGVQRVRVGVWRPRDVEQITTLMR